MLIVSMIYCFISSLLRKVAYDIDKLVIDHCVLLPVHEIRSQSVCVLLIVATFSH